jgi:predicted GIY-YIG superfamily endonuclease
MNPTEKTWTVYVLRCSNNSVYVGCTNNLDNRLYRHEKGQVMSTKYRLPVKVITDVVFSDKYKAYNFEKYLKSGSGRAFLNKRLI